MMDNARIHKSRRVTEFFRENGVEFQYLPPYTPDLNPIENAFGTVKANYRSEGIPMTRDAMMAQLGNVLENFNVDLHPYYDRMRTFVQKALHRENFN